MRYIIIAGSNVGDSLETFRSLPKLFAAHNVLVLKSTAPVVTQPELDFDQAPFYNGGFLVESKLSPLEVLAVCQSIENQLGRQKRRRFGPREIDLDIVWAEEEFRHKDLNIPHRHNRNREWVRQCIYLLDNALIDSQTLVAYKDMQIKSIKNIHDFAKKKRAGEKITLLTCYDYSFAKLFARTTLDCILIGDSLGHIIKGQTNTLDVSVDEIIYHSRAVRRACPDKFIVADMPFLSASLGIKKALQNAGKLVAAGHANAVKIEGAGKMTKVIGELNANGIPVMGHLGLQPQMFHITGGYRLQGKNTSAAQQLIDDAKKLQDSGAFALVLEMIPANVAKAITEAIEIPTIGIGAGKHCDGQVLVSYDLLGIDEDFAPTFLRKYANLSGQILTAIEEYCRDVRSLEYPNEKESHGV